MIKLLDFPQQCILQLDSLRLSLNRKIDMICQCDINTLIQLYIQILFRIGNDITRELHML